MHAIYERLEREGVIGPFVKNGEGVMVPRPGWRADYPKDVRNADGKIVTVKTLDEEVRVAGAPAAEGPPDPLASERQALADRGAEVDAKLRELDDLRATMKAQLEELAEARAALQGNVAKKGAPARA